MQKNNTRKTKAEREVRAELTDEDIDRIADGLLMDYEYDEKRIFPLVGLLRHLQLAAANPGTINPCVEDVVWKINNRILAGLNDKGLHSFQEKALSRLHDALARRREASHA